MLLNLVIAASKGHVVQVGEDVTFVGYRLGLPGSGVTVDGL